MEVMLARSHIVNSIVSKTALLTLNLLIFVLISEVVFFACLTLNILLITKESC